MDNQLRCERINKGLTQLTTLLNDDFCSRALDMENSHEHRAMRERVNRLTDAIDQYANRNAQVTYIGLVGHFSSGKSSTLNSLLDLNGTPNERVADQHPTDTVVTVLTSEANSKKLSGLARRGRVGIVIKTIEGEAFDKCAFLDTPGSGDPGILDPIIEDILPLCDLLLFVMSGASPLDESDRPILARQFQALPEIPTKFVLTRADEFKRDRALPLTDQNFDSERASASVATTLARLRTMGILSEKQDFFVIDNFAQVGIDRLKKFVSEVANKTDAATILHLHEHKVAYFNREAGGLREHFKGALSQKLKLAREASANAKRSRTDFASTVEITNSRLTESWRQKRTSLTVLTNAAVARVRTARHDLSLPVDVWESDKMRAIAPGAHKVIAAASKEVAAEIIGAQTSLILTMLRERLEAMEGALDDLAEKSIEAWAPDTVRRATAEKVELARLVRPGWVEYEFQRAPGSVATAMAELKREIEENYYSLLGYLRSRTTIEEFQSRIQESRDGLSADLKVCFIKAEAYRTAVFAFKNIPLMRQLGAIADLTDGADVKLTDEFKEEVWRDLDRSLHPEYESRLHEFDNETRELINFTQSRLDQFSKYTVGKESTETKSVDISQLTSALKRKWDKLSLLGATESASRKDVALSQIALAKAVISDARMMKVKTIASRIKWVGISLLSLALFWLAYLILGDKASPSSLRGSLAIELGGALLCAIAAGLLLRLKQSFAEKLTPAIDSASTMAQAHASIRQMLTEPWTAPDDEGDIANVALLLEQKWRFEWENELESHSTHAAELYLAYRDEIASQEQFRDRHANSISVLGTSLAEYFANTDSNLSKLGAATTTIQEEAIVRSFEIIENVERRLERLEGDVGRVAFV